MFSQLIKLRTTYLIIVLLALGACKTGSTQPIVFSQNISNSADKNPTLWPKRQANPPLYNDIELRIEELIASMSVEEKVGQIVQPELKYVSAQDVRDYHLGSVLNGGGTTPNNDKYASVQDWADLAEDFYQASMDESDGNIGIPLIWGSDAIHGNNNLFGATIFPHNIGLGAANDIDLMRRIGRATALEVAATGVDWTFGPTVAVVRDIRWGRTYESYSEDPQIVKNYTRELIRGIQGEALKPGEYQAGHLVSTAKHFLGDGGTTNGIDRGDTAVSEQELIDVHAAGYISALDGDVLTTMASFNSWNGEKLHGHDYLLNDILKSQMGFTGFIVSDWNGHSHVPGCSVTNCPQAINAGIDMVMVPEHWKEFYASTILAVKQGDIPIQRLDDAVTRILRVKHIAGLFSAGSISERALVGDSSLVGHADHRAVAREAVRKSLVLLKNNKKVLPISADAKILVAGDGADNIGKQSGGWTISWQGTGNSNQDFPGATSILDGIEQAISDQGEMHYDLEGNWDQDSFSDGSSPDVAIVIYGEDPYAEWHGDIANIEYQYGQKSDLVTLQKLQEQSIPVVSVFISGRPLWTNKELNASDAFIAAWLPGTEGSGIADVVIAKQGSGINYDFQGKLSFSWPKSVDQAVLNVGQANYDPLFAYGYGLNYQTDTIVSNDLPEESRAKATTGREELWAFVSRAISPWIFSLQDQGEEAVIVNSNTASSGDANNLRLSSIDKVSQEDARSITWNGQHAATLKLESEIEQDLGAYFQNNANLSFELKLDAIASKPIAMNLECGGGQCGKTLSVDNHLASLQTGVWLQVAVPLSCFQLETDLHDNVTSMFSMTSEGPLEVSLANIKIATPTTNDSQNLYAVEICD